MANRFLGEVDVAVGDKRWRLRLDFNTMIEFEDMTGKDAMSSFEAMEKGEATLRDMRAMVHACMLHHHADATARPSFPASSTSSAACPVALPRIQLRSSVRDQASVWQPVWPSFLNRRAFGRLCV